MIYEWRVYEITPGKRTELHERFATHTVSLFAKHGIRVVGFWESVVGGASNTLYYMLVFDSLAQREKAWADFQNDPEWKTALANSERNGPLTVRITNMILQPTTYSPMK